MRVYIITIVTILGLYGCLLKPQFPETGNIAAQPQPAYQKPPQPVEAAYEPVKGIITLYEAMARAVKKNYTPRLGIMEKSLADSRLNPPLYNTLPSIVRSAGYGDNSGEIKSQFYSQASGQSYDNIVMWNILDYGLSFAAYTQNNNQVTETIKHKVMQNIIHEVRYAYYRTASAQSLLNQARELSKQARIVLDQGNESYGLNPRQSMKIHENKRKLIENVRVIWEYIQKTTSAKSNLGFLMDLPPDTMFQIAEPDWNVHESADLKQTMSGMDMEYLAMENRTEIQETGFKNNAGVYETRKAILKMQPGVNFDSGYETGNNNFIYSKDWRDAGLQISKTLFDLLPAAQTSHNQAEAEYSKGMALKMAVTTQLHLARQQYIMAKEMYNLSAILINPVNKSSLTAKNAAGIKNETDDLISRIRFHEAYTELEMAADRLFNSFGITRLPADINSASVSYLTTALKNSLNKRARFLSQKSFDTEPKKNEAAYKPAQTLADKPENIPDIKKPSPVPADKPSESYNFQSKQAVVVNASAAEKKGQKPVREISVFRDVVNIHFEPSAKSEIKGQGLIGERYNLLGWSPKGWLKIEMSDGSYGWIPTKYAKPIENEDSEDKFTQPEIPEKQVKINPAPAPKPADRMILTTTRANVRTGPGLNFKVIYISEKGSRFKVQGSSGEWFEIRTKSGSKGWLHDSTVKVLAGN